MTTKYKYCKSSNCLHRRGCRRWLPLYIESKEIKALLNSDDENLTIHPTECLNDDESYSEILEDGTEFNPGYIFLDRFRNSDGSETCK